MFVACSTDFEKTFVCGDIMTFEDLKEYGSEAAVKAVRPLRSTFRLCFPGRNARR